ncbi:MAG: hypothetical protein ACO1TE_23890 [Prosthecobacter sp.]
MNLIQPARELSEQWHAVSVHWRDAKAQEFEKLYLEQIPALVNKTGAAMNEIEVLLKKIRKDCEQSY